ncbi:MAG: response regulator transcription factor [Mariprofundaceae bacterium]
MTIRIQIIDDHEVVRHGLKLLLNSMQDIEVVCESASGEQGYSDYFKHHPDLVLLDLKMPGEGGMNTLRRMLVRDPKARVMILTMFDDVVFPRRALEAGALGYITKDATPEVLEGAIHTVNEGQRFVEPHLAQEIVLTPENQDAPSHILTAREFEVFTMLARGDSVREIAGHLHLSPKTVNVHRANILKKMKVNNAVKLAHIAVRHGIVLS